MDTQVKSYEVRTLKSTDVRFERVGDTLAMTLSDGNITVYYPWVVVRSCFPVSDEKVFLSVRDGESFPFQDCRRALHNVKGELNLLGQTGCGELVHEAEALVQMYVERNKVPHGEIVECLLQVTDVLDSCIRAVIAGGDVSTDALLNVKFSLLEYQNSLPVCDTVQGSNSSGSDGGYAGFRPRVPEIAPGSAEMFSDFITETREHLAQAEEALLGYARAHARLPPGTG